MSASLYITKRNGRQELFSIEKIKNAIRKAFLSTGSFVTEEEMTDILSRLNLKSGMSVEEIQNQVEVSLMAERYFEVAKSFILYRHKHTEDRDTSDRLKFLVDYCAAENAATGSKFDANANVDKIPIC